MSVRPEKNGSIWKLLQNAGQSPPPGIVWERLHHQNKRIGLLKKSRKQRGR